MVADDVQKEWLRWLQQEHIPEMLATGCFTRATILHLREVEDTGGATYAVQYYAQSHTQYEHYLQEFASGLRAKALAKWGHKTMAFRTTMDIVN